MADPEAGDELGDTIERAAEAEVGWRGAVEAIERNASERIGIPVGPDVGFVLASVGTSLVLAPSSDRSFEDTVIETLALGDDADTVGAMVGGMAGASAGPDAIPDRWRDTAGADALEAWGRAADGLPDLLELERELGRLLGGA